MQRRLAVYRVLRIAGVALPAIAAYRWLETRERLGWPAPPATWERVHDRVARGLHDLGVHLAGFFVKLCQVVGARADNFQTAPGYQVRVVRRSVTLAPSEGMRVVVAQRGAA